jgi:pSer/pThr/pTyr-binding forkhead associated (FHA) protein
MPVIEGPKPTHLLLKNGMSEAEVVMPDPHGFCDAVVGRSRDADISVNSLRLSRRHAVFRQRENLLLLEDLESTNGTFVNGQRISGITRLFPGDVVTMGPVTIRVNQVPTRALSLFDRRRLAMHLKAA